MFNPIFIHLKVGKSCPSFSQHTSELDMLFEILYNRLFDLMLFLFASTEIQWSSWLEPFQYQLWLSIVGIINLILIVIWWIDRKSPYGHYRQLDSGDDGFTILGILMRST